MLKKIVRAILITLIVMFTITAVIEIPKYTNGQYIEKEAIITYVNILENSNNNFGFKSNYERVNGKIEYTYNDKVYKPEKYINFQKDAKVGDTITILMDKDTGEYNPQNVAGLTFTLAIWVSFFLALLNLTYKKPKTDIQKLNINHRT